MVTRQYIEVGLSFLVATMIAAPGWSQTGGESGDPSVGLTVYNQNFAIVREERSFDLPAGRSEVRVQNVAAKIVPESVQFRSLDPPGGAIVIEQNYEFDLATADALLRRYIDKPIGLVTRQDAVIEGKLLNYDHMQFVLAGGNGIQLVPRQNNVRDLRFSKLPDGLLTRPTLVWSVEAKRAGLHRAQVAYRTDQINWNVNYRAVADADGETVDLSGWVTVTNMSGRTYPDARLKLMAGDVNVITPHEYTLFGGYGGATNMVFAQSDTRAPGFEEKTFAEYHLYTLPRPTTIKEQQTKQIELINILGVPVHREYEVRSNRPGVRAKLVFENAEETHRDLGIPLPKGPIRVYQRDADGQEEFIGSDEIDHTPKDEDIEIVLGEVFDITAERTQTDNRLPGNNINEQDWRVRVRNHKDKPVTVDVVEILDGSDRRHNRRITVNNHPFEMEDYQTAVFTVDIEANGEKMVTYTVRYTW